MVQSVGVQPGTRSVLAPIGGQGSEGTALGGSTTSTPERRPHVINVVVRPGDTLWTIAQRVAPHSDPRKVVDGLAAARGTADVRAGDTIRVAI